MARDIYNAALCCYTPEKQIVKMMEEMGELTHALGRYLLDGDTDATVPNVQEEIADVEIMLTQMGQLFGEEEVYLVKCAKLKRLEERIAEKECRSGN